MLSVAHCEPSRGCASFNLKSVMPPKMIWPNRLICKQANSIKHLWAQHLNTAQCAYTEDLWLCGGGCEGNIEYVDEWSVDRVNCSDIYRLTALRGFGAHHDELRIYIGDVNKALAMCAKIKLWPLYEAIVCVVRRPVHQDAACGACRCRMDKFRQVGCERQE